MEELKPGSIIEIDGRQAEVLQVAPEVLEVRFTISGARCVYEEGWPEYRLLDDSGAIDIERFDLDGSPDARRRAERDLLDP